jgi:lipoate---protein ligase
MKIFQAPNLACDQLLRWDESLIAREEPEEGVAVWEFDRICVVLGRGSKSTEASQEHCTRDGIPVLQRCSGGASIVAGPGCLMYSVILSLKRLPKLKAIDQAHSYVMGRLLSSLIELDFKIELQGICDLTRDGKKFSGNALRYRRDWLLYHGTILYDFPLELISRYLQTPPRQPEYRAGRSHIEFVTNWNVPREEIIAAVLKAWQSD